ncbi:universal stress protein [Pseudobacillus wudalianchiensis]|uniref:Universal stress protein n=1 Tax=Pseudobacillus wudalianchiensis TaxID=1743143 RepID=A0A1B9ABS9_9BACI|nr:universal stress protein [Bacillus wudalianchiensis]OCA81251.1 universal stress protein [Bacillus wudalianchiensis]
MYKKVLLAVDGSENSLRAAQEAGRMASLVTGCKIEVVYVVDFAKSKRDTLHVQSTEELDLFRRQNQRVEEELKSQKAAYEVKILHGEPGPAIVKYANEEKFNLVIIGSRGLNALQEMVLGSVSHKVMKRVHCPALIVK